ncbi:MAG: GNAT family N-acetyltransferase, partial [Akkermansiaceae bacterium]
ALYNSLRFPVKQRFELRSGPGDPAVISYRQHGDKVIIEHTYVPERLRGKGIAASITQDALLEARRLGWKIVPDCSYMESYIQRHPEFNTLLHKP